ncbi:Signal peptidase complex subunit [Emydomyces testavorans]|uniref:Signal peptidase subunit 3 n=1 Tax=Emydomyces testavorans TaxID=2070801 RepID=A0AAF0DD24_9EURO|nr:Signal peptidase complex subunit [Emydomyces testavorans]
MHSALNRAQSVFGFFTSVALVLGILTSLSVVLHPASPVMSIELSNIQVIKGRPHYYSAKREEYAQIRFDLDADLSSLFNWNTKQLFVYVLASYPSSSSSSSSSTKSLTTTTESVIWDTIIPARVSPYSFSSLKARFFPASNAKQRRSSNNNSNKKKAEKIPGKIKLRNQKPKYQITDISGSLAERKNATLLVGWNVQPWIGALQWNAGTNIERNLAGVFGGAFISRPRAGRSKPFDFPPLKGKINTSTQRTEASGS